MTSSNTTFKPRALAPYIRAKDAATGALDRDAGVYTIQVCDLGRVTWAKTYDHDDIEADFRADCWLQVASNIMLSVIVFCWLTASITIMLQVPDAWLSWIDLYLWGV